VPISAFARYRGKAAPRGHVTKALAISGSHHNVVYLRHLRRAVAPHRHHKPFRQ